MKRTAGLFLLLLLFSWPVSLWAREEVRVVDSFVINSQTDLLLFFGLSGSFTPKMEQGIKNGIPVAFTFFVELLEQQKDQPLVPLLSKSFRHTITYDTLKDRYKVILSERNDQHIIYEDFSRAKYRMAVVSDFAVIPLTSLKPQASYTVRIKSALAKTNLPGEVNEMVTLLKLWDFETSWQEFAFAVPKAIPTAGGSQP